MNQFLTEKKLHFCMEHRYIFNVKDGHISFCKTLTHL